MIARQRAALIEPLDSRVLLATFTPTTSAALTSNLASAQLGDTIILQAGTTYTGNFILKNKTTGSGWITIESSNLAALPEGRRISPADAVNMPKIVAPGSNVPAIQAEYGAAIGAHHFKFLGLEIAGPANNSSLTNLVELGTTDGVQNSLTMMPHDFVVDRCYMHSNFDTTTQTYSQNLRRAVALNSGATDITNCYIQEIHDANGDSQAIGGSNGAGPYNILNNFLEAASENILFGGSGCYIPNTVPSDIVIRGNYFYKPTTWMGVWAVKNLFELKEGRRITVEGNVFENNWVSGQDGTAIVLKLDQYSSSRPWQVTEDVTFQKNIVRHAANAVALQGRDYTNNSPAGLVRRLTITNNLFDDINKTPWANWKDPNGSGGNFLYLTQGPQYVTFTHNTAINSRSTINLDSSCLTYPATGFVYQNNLAAHNTYGVFSSEYGTGDNSITNYLDNHGGGTFTKNVLMGGPSNSYKNHPGNFFPATWGDVGFVDFANRDYHLTTASAYHNAGTDGKDIGANMDDIAAATATAINGNSDPPPTITALGFQNQVAQPAIWYTLSEAIATPVASNLSFTNLDSASGSTPTVSSVQYDSVTHTVTFNLATPIPDGDFRATLAGVHDSANNALSGDGSLDFYFLGCDANGDRVVNALDFNALASNFGRNSATFSQGDFTYNRIVNTLDFNALAANFNKNLLPSAPPPSYSDQVLSRNPIVYLDLNDTSGTVAADSSPHGYDGTYGAGVTLGQSSASSQLGTAIHTPGTTTSNSSIPVKINDSAAIGALNAVGTGSFSIEFWFNTSDISNREDLFDFRAGGNTNIDFGIQISNTAGVGKFSVFHNNTAVITASASTDPTVTTNAWHQLVLTRDGTNGAERLFYDGALVGTSGTDALAFTTDATGALAFGNKTSGTARLTLGLLDELAIYPSALSPADIASDYALALSN